jgi:hypothetical protein
MILLGSDKKRHASGLSENGLHSSIAHPIRAAHGESGN